MPAVSRGVFLSLLAGAFLPAQAPPQESGVVLRSTTRMVQVNVIVQDKKGNQVADLRKEDFTIKDGGKTQEIRAFSVESKSKPYTPAAQLPPNVFSNRLEQRSGTPNSVTIILLDGLNTRWGDQLSAVPHVVKFLQQIQPGDRVAIFGLSRDLRILHDYTSDTDDLLKTLANYRGLHSGVLGATELTTNLPGHERTPRLASESGVAAVMRNAPEDRSAIQGLLDLMEDEANYHEELRIKTTLKALEGIANHVASIPGRKNLVWVSSAFPLLIGFMPGPGQSLKTGLSNPNSAQNSSTPGQPQARRASPSPGQRQQQRAEENEGEHMKRIFGRNPMTFDNEVNRTVRALNNANLAVYPVDARGLTTDPNAYTNISTMKELASRTGGKAYYNTNDLQRSIREAVADSSVTYALAYYPSEQNGDGKFREIRVRVKRPGLVVRHRRGYFDTGELEPTDEAAREAALVDAVWSPLDATGVRLDARLDFDGPPEAGKMIAHLLIDASSVSLEQRGGRWIGKLDVLLLQTDDKGNGLEPVPQTIRIEATEETYRSALKTGFVFRYTLPRQSAAQTLRIVVRDAPSGNLGSVSIPFNKVVRDLRTP